MLNLWYGFDILHLRSNIKIYADDRPETRYQD